MHTIHTRSAGLKINEDVAKKECDRPTFDILFLFLLFVVLMYVSDMVLYLYGKHRRNANKTQSAHHKLTADYTLHSKLIQVMNTRPLILLFVFFTEYFRLESFYRVSKLPNGFGISTIWLSSYFRDIRRQN